ncbi:RNA polymerase II transcriptional coactivator KIWI-like [Penaeus chinensis]|uniref:RNA polymerase II transcriptional coactivator KIWI-like n=1 Tax=Penaeus chinensis TaxID=139456 RepID=UPI001FB59110|nr:RNA polymerase II transcriptional coactivator KIWI-like [Penaeus chinensis]
MPKDKDLKHKSKKLKNEESSKRKADSDDDDTSDTSVEDEPVQKSSSGDHKTNEQGEPFLSIDKNRRVTIREFKGKTYIDIREFYEKDGKLLPGKKGISLSVSQYNNLKSAMTTIDKLL